MKQRNNLAVLFGCICFIVLSCIFEFHNVHATTLSYIEQNFTNFTLGTLTKDTIYEQFKFTGDYYNGEAKKESGNTYTHLFAANANGKVIYSLQNAGLNNVTYSNCRYMEYDFRFGGNDTGDVYLLGNHIRAIYDSVSENYYINLVGSSPAETLTFNTPVSRDNWHNIQILFYANGNNKKVYSIKLDGSPVSTLMNGTAYDYNTAVFSAHGSYTLDVKYAATGSFSLFTRMKIGYLDIDNLKYTSGDFNADIVPSTADKMIDFPIDGSIKIKFSHEPVLSTLTNDTIQVLKNGTEKLLWTNGSYNHDTKEYTIDFGEEFLELNTRYQIKVLPDIQTADTLIRNVLPIESLFLTYDNKLEIKSVLVNGQSIDSVGHQLQSGVYNVDLHIKNKIFNENDFNIILGLFRKDGQTSTLMSYQQTSKSATIGQDVVFSDSISVPEDQYSYYIKGYIWDGLQNQMILSNTFVIGVEPKYTVVNTLTDSSLALLPLETVVETGMFKIRGKYSVLEGRNINLEVTDPNGQLVFLDQKIADKDGYFGFDFQVKVGSPDGDYRYVVKNSQGDCVEGSIFMAFSTAKPALKNVSYDGKSICETTIGIKYNYVQFANRGEKTHSVEWFISDNENDGYISAGTEDELYLPNDFVHKYIKYTISVISIDDIISTQYMSEPIQVYAIPKISNLRLVPTINRVDTYYSYAHLLGYEEYNSTFSWYISDTISGTYQQVSNKKDAYYIINQNDDMKYIKVEITPCANIPEENSLERVGFIFVSEPVLMHYTNTDASPTRTGGTSSSNGGSSTKGSSSTIIVPVIIPKPELNVVFSDIEGHWSKNSVLMMYDKGIVKGRTEKEFEPDGIITRAEFVAMVVRAFQLPTKPYENEFSDVSGTEWYANDIKTALDNSILSGSDGKAFPTAGMTRQELAAFVVKTYESLGGITKVDGILEFKDATEITAWARIFVGKAKETKLMEGIGDGYFNPLQLTTRAEACVVLERLISIGGISRDSK